MGKFDDIRPYRDAEVPAVIKRLIKNDDFISAISGFKLPKLKKKVAPLADQLVKTGLKKKLRKVETVSDAQELVSDYVVRILETSTTGVKQSGLAEIDQSTPHLYMSNHRDIVMDPALIGYLLRNSVYGTVEIAIGDNLLKKEYISDLMRLNKSFIVKRSVQGREKLVASKQLSEYIHDCIETKKNVWIAQREGRAKNGIDKTDPAILKMLNLGKREEKMDLKESTNLLHIIPVSISYEYDPCAEMKARELYEIETNGSFVKDEKSDIVSISTGMNGQKGNIHLKFGSEIHALENDAAAIALQIDQQIVMNYKLHPSNYIAYEKLQNADQEIGPELDDNITLTAQKRDEFEAILAEIPEELKPYFLKIYANPVVNQFRLKTEIA